MKKYVIWGAGDYGKKALKKFCRNNIDFFIDNDTLKQNKTIEGIKIISFHEFLKINNKQSIVIAMQNVDNILNIISQLEKNNINDYELYSPIYEIKSIYPEDKLIFNQYEYLNEAKSEEEWTQKTKEIDKKYYNLYISDLYRKQPLFETIEIETYNRCNGYCSFCPVNANRDPRKQAKMPDDLFKKVINELETLNYSGRLSLFSNNEPFLDDRIIKFHVYARKHAKKARIHLYTNGTLLTLEIFKNIIDLVDELIIDNYNQELKLTSKSKAIKEYVEAHPELIKKVTIALRKPDEILTSRGGNAPNRKNIETFPKDKCIYPFTQMIIRPDGKCSLCCNDPLGLVTLGDVSKNTLYDTWYGKEYIKLRNAIYNGRENVPHCIKCDNFYY